MIGTGAVVPPDVDAQVRALLTGVVPALALLVWTLWCGRTVGEAAVRLRPRRPGSTPAVVLRWLVGIGGYLFLSASTPDLFGLGATLLDSEHGDQPGPPFAPLPRIRHSPPRD